jgi:hypothetical protein
MSDNGGGVGRRGLVIGAVLVGLLIVVVIVVVAVTGRSSVHRWIADNFRRVGNDTYASQQAPAATASRILGRFGTGQRVDSQGNVFLRYDDDLVGILPSGAGSRITVDDYDRGYDRYRSHVGHVWVGGSSFRGGGPGDGK